MKEYKDDKKIKKPPQGQSYFGIGKIVIWIIGLVIILILKLCGFDIAYPTGAP